MKKIIKAGSISNLTDARFFASYGVDYIGFCFDPLSPNYISPSVALAMKGWLHNVKIVAEFANQDVENIKEMIHFLEPDVIELDILFFNAHQELFDDYDFQKPVILKCTCEQIKMIENKNYLFILLDDFNVDNISTINFPIMINLSYNEIISPASVIYAIQIKGSPESEIGMKDYEILSEFLDQLTT